MAGYQNRFQYTCEGLEHLLGMVKDQTGGILISAHNGNWELAGHVLSIDAKINIVIYEGEHEKIKQYLSNVKKDNSVNLIVVNNNSFDHLYKINEALENHEFVCMHGDRFVEGSKTMTCQFLGEEARFPMGPFLLATQLQAPVSFVYAMKESAYHYHLFATKPVTYGYQSDRQQRNTQVTMALQNYVRSLEGMVQRFPTHWFNYYPFWQASTLKEEEKKDSFSRRRETAT
jgi:predicted LPLAT superfamily acyltransferase